MEEHGLYRVKANKGPGSRKNGLELIRPALRNSVSVEGPRLYFTRSCKAATLTLLTEIRDEDDPDDVDTLAGDHSYDAIRYRLLDDFAKWPVKVNATFAK
jgi:hypothetical protein